MSKNGLIVLVPYKTGQEFYSEYDYENGDDEENEDFLETNEDDEDFLEADEDENLAYLPVYVETEDQDLALMAVAYEACQCTYVTFSSSIATAQEWEESPLAQRERGRG